MKKLLIVLIIVLGFILVGCEGPELSPIFNSITINGSQKLYIGDEATYEAVFDPNNYYNQEVIWSSSDETKLTINQETGLATALDETGEEGVYIYATLKDKSNINGSKKIFIYKPDYHDPVYPDLQEYTIRIAQDEVYLHNTDPFLEGYKQSDKAAKQQAWREVEELFNCKIEVAAYPGHADWGPWKWIYILNQAQLGVSDYDFLTVPDSKIPTFVEGGALISMEEFYALYGNNMMDPTFITSGSYQGNLYSFNTSKNNIYNVMYYNIGLLETLQKYNNNLKEPARIFLDGDWTFEKFEDYCQEVQDTMAQAFGVKGTAGDAGQEYFAVSGWDSYWWVGLSSNDGEPLADVNNITININTPHKVQAAEVVKSLYNSGIADPRQNIEQNVTRWNEGKALFNTGDLWFVKADNRWSSNLWGEDTRYGYVPWPRANDVDFDEIQVALGGTETWVMPIGRDYSQYGEECTTENIYWAIAELFRRTDEYYKSSKDYDENTEMKNLATQFADSEASQAAFIYVQKLIKSGKGYFDPLVTSDNSVGSLYTNSTARTTIKGAVTQYCATGTVGTWEEAISALLPILIESVRKRFG